jgi:predicted metal-binding membrane protein
MHPKAEGGIMTDREIAPAVAGSPNAVGRRTANSRGSGVSTTVVAATLAVAAACWVIAIWRMTGMDMGVATELGSFGSFAALWLAMMAAMMLPGAIPAVVQHVRVGGALAAPWFVGTYMIVWAAVGFIVYALYRPHGTALAAAFVIAAGAYELTPLKRHFRRRCNDQTRSGFEYGLCCVGSSIGLMLVLVVLGVMNIGWMLAVAAVVIAQKLLPPKAAIDVPMALAIVALGIVVAVAPATFPGLVPSM